MFAQVVQPRNQNSEGENTEIAVNGKVLTVRERTKFGLVENFYTIGEKGEGQEMRLGDKSYFVRVHNYRVYDNRELRSQETTVHFDTKGQFVSREEFVFGRGAQGQLIYVRLYRDFPQTGFTVKDISVTTEAERRSYDPTPPR